jgi:hypothetical protein
VGHLLTLFQKGRSGNRTILANFVGKVEWSTAENPHKFTGAKTLVATVSTPYNSSGDVQQSYINAAMALDGVLSNPHTTNVSGEQAQHGFYFDLIQALDRTFGVGTVVGTTTAEKVAWLKANVKSLTCNWWGFGSSSTGNKATFSVWRSDLVAWGTSPISHVNGSVTRISYSLAGIIGGCIDTNGLVNFLAYADPANGTINSIVNTDYVELIIVF